MPDFLKVYGECTGPFGFPMQEEDARELDKLIETHSKDSAFEYKRQQVNGLDSIVLTEHSDVSVVTDSTVDKDKEIVRADGVDWTSFRKNPVVSLQHMYWQPPIGKSLWQKQVGDVWKAKTKYLTDRPENYPEEKEWIPDTVWHFVKNGVMAGKSIGFLPVDWHQPSKEEKSKYQNLELIFDKIKVFEYAAVTIPANDNAIVEEIGKGFRCKEFADLLGIKVPVKSVSGPPVTDFKIDVKGISVNDYRKMVDAKLGAEFQKLQKSIPEKIDDLLARFLGKV